MSVDWFSGEHLYGDDFSGAELEAWHRDEISAYYHLATEESQETEYSYHALNERHGFSTLRRVHFDRVLGLGSARGDELRPILLTRASKITIVEPAAGFRAESLEGVPVEYIEPAADGLLPFDNDTFDLITCFGVLHHVANVSTVIRELHRCLRPNGWMLLREPIISMGDWRYPRPGLTTRERGIPVKLLDQMTTNVGFRVEKRRLCMFGPLIWFARMFEIEMFNSHFLTAVDEIACSLPFWSARYHATRPWHRFRAGSVFYSLQKKTRQH